MMRPQAKTEGGEPRRHKQRSRFLARLRQARRNEDGATAVEFALISIPFFAIIIALLEVALINLTTLDLENAAKSASRQIRTGQAQEQGLSSGAFKTLLCAKTTLLPNCAGNGDLVVDVKNYDDFTSVDTSNDVYDENGDWSGSEEFKPGSGSKVAVVRVFYKMKLHFKFPYVNLANVGDSHYMIETFFIFRNEPF